VSREMEMAPSTHVCRIVDLSEVGLTDVGLAGCKGANLGEMIAAGLPVPAGFVITAEAARRAKDSVCASTLPTALEEVLQRRYLLVPDGEVAVRSSATAEDSTNTSFAGMNETFTNVREPELLQRIIDCWESLFGERVASYRIDRKPFDEPAIAVSMQQMVAWTEPTSCSRSTPLHAI